MKNNTIFKRATVLLLIVVMLCTALPMVGYAASDLTIVNSSGDPDDFIVTKFKVNNNENYPGGTMTQWTVLEIDMEFELPDGGVPENSTTIITLPDGLKFHSSITAAPFNLSVDGDPSKTFASAVADLTNKTITLTYTDYSSGKNDIEGQLRFSIMAGFEISITSETITITHPVTNEPINLVYNRTPFNNSLKADKYGSVSYDETGDFYYITYTLRLNPSGEFDFDKITDNLGSFAYPYDDATIDWENGFIFRFAYYHVDNEEWKIDNSATDPVFPQDTYRTTTWSDLVATTTSPGTNPFHISSIAKTNGGRGFEINFSETIENAVHLSYKVILGSDKPAHLAEFPNTVTLHNNTTTFNGPTTVIYRHDASGSGSGTTYVYYVEITKTYEGGAPLTDAEFVLRKGIAVDSDIVSDFTYNGGGIYMSDTSVPAGIYYIHETGVPDGYLPIAPREVPISATTANGNRIVAVGIENKLAKDYEIIINKYVTDTTDKLLGATFELYTDDGSGTAKPGNKLGEFTDNGDGTYKYTGLAAGGYLIVETKAPDGYKLPADPVQKVTIDADGAKTVIVRAFNDKGGGGWFPTNSPTPSPSESPDIPPEESPDESPDTSTRPPNNSPTPEPSPSSEPRPSTEPPTQPPTTNPVVHNDDDTYTEFDENGTPLGTWTYDEELEEWVFEEFVPLGALPTGDTGNRTLYAIIIIVAVIAIASVLVLSLPRKRKSGR